MDVSRLSVEEIASIQQHIANYIGIPKIVNHEVTSNIVHIDIFIVPATTTREYHTLITAGMSALPTKTTDDEEEWKYTELMLYLPSKWGVSKEELKDPDNYWPLALLRNLGRFPHEKNTWFSLGDTIPNGEPPKPFVDRTELSNVVLLPPMKEKREFFELQMHQDKKVRFMVVAPIYNEELLFLHRNGFNEFLDILDKSNFNDVLDLQRKNILKNSY